MWLMASDFRREAATAKLLTKPDSYQEIATG